LERELIEFFGIYFLKKKDTRVLLNDYFLKNKILLKKNKINNFLKYKYNLKKNNIFIFKINKNKI
jgi:hypothetical protein